MQMLRYRWMIEALNHFVQKSGDEKTLTGFFGMPRERR
jgi:hypothetical protein